MTIERMPIVGLRGVGIGIVAAGATKSLVDWDSTEWSYWSMNDFYHFFARRLGRTYEMHVISHYTDPTQFFPGHEAALAGMGPNAVLAIPNPKIPNATIYPLDKVLARFGRDYFCSSIAYIIPHAIMTIEKSQADGDGIYAPKIGLWGCDMQLTSDYAKERACVEYWLAKAEGAGIEVVIPSESPLLKAGYRYGYDMPLITARKRIIDARRLELSEQLARAREMDRIANDRVSSLQAMIDEAGWYELNLTDVQPNTRPFE